MSDPRNAKRLLLRAIGKADASVEGLSFKCLHPGCGKVAIRSHSQQKERSLRIISEGGQVYALQKSTYQMFNESAEKSTVKFVRTGLGRASTFYRLLHRARCRHF